MGAISEAWTLRASFELRKCGKPSMDRNIQYLSVTPYSVQQYEFQAQVLSAAFIPIVKETQQNEIRALHHP